jgi:uncharacterized protein (DUF2141 family)
MSKFLPALAVAATALAAQPSSAQASLGPDASACRSGGPAVLVNVRGFKSKTGKVRVQLYPANQDFLAKGKWLRRVDLPVTSASMPVCVSVPRAGTYAVAVRHDADGNGKSGWNDGGGFSRNPSISLTDLKPKPGEVAISVGNGVKPVDVVLNYRRGLKIAPISKL